jgi:hypothetical protein
MPDPSEIYSMQPMTPNPLPPGMNPAEEAVKQETARQVQAAASGAGNVDLGDLADVAEGVVDLVGAVVDSSAAADVGAEVVGGALEALGSGFEVVGGCAEGCSLMIAVVVLLAAAGSALAYGLF